MWRQREGRPFLLRLLLLIVVAIVVILRALLLVLLVTEANTDLTELVQDAEVRSGDFSNEDGRTPLSALGEQSDDSKSAPLFRRVLDLILALSLAPLV